VLSSPSRAALCDGAPVGAPLVQRRLMRFSNRYFDAVRELAGRDNALADLAVSFPALLFALAAPRLGQVAVQGVAAVAVGRPLKEIAALVGAPMWLRALPPESFVAPIGRLPDSAFFRRRIANHLPRSPRLAPIWLEAVSDAAKWGDEGIAVWVARELTRNVRDVSLARLRLVCLWAWQSQQDGSLAVSLSQSRWTSSLSFVSAVAQAENWIANIRVACAIGMAPITDVWLKPEMVEGYEFKPIRTTMDLISEAFEMKHCVRDHASNLARDRARLWSIQRNGVRVATLEVGAGLRGDPYLGVRQLRGRENKAPANEVYRATHNWLRQQQLFLAPTIKRREAPDRAAWIAFWRPYWLAKRRIPDWLPLSPSQEALNALAAARR
jgi:hypothetical protein